MITKTFAYDIVFCLECNKWIIYKIADGIPKNCPRCGIAANVALNPQQKAQMERNQQSQEGFNVRTHFMRFN